MSTPADSKVSDPYRLPKNIKPVHYSLLVRTDLDALEFQGRVAIELDVLEETSTVSLNVAKLDIDHVTLLWGDNTTEIKEQHLDEDLERLTLKTGKPLSKGRAHLVISFRGPLGDQIKGYYRSQTEIDGKKMNYSLTQFAPTDTRKAFPCWDEPALKATFDIIMVSREGTVNLSNMPVAFEVPLSRISDQAGDSTEELALGLASLKMKGSEAGWKLTRFQTSPIMSTYLVAYANGPFEYVEDYSTSPLTGKVRPVRVYGTKDVIHQAKFALDVNTKCLSIYESVFDIEFPIPKLDVLVAHDFESGAMENWGLIVGRTTAYLIDEKSAITLKKRIAGVATHEVAHQWFGNITTMEWWDVLYLNEGFATLMGELVILDKLFPEWGCRMSFINDHLERALALDAQRSSHPIEVPCDDAKKLHMIFDALSYSKAGAVLRMLSEFVTEEKFLKGVSLYLKKHLYSNARTVDLWNGVSEATGQDVASIMHEWINNVGFPVLKVTETSDGITVRQERYLETGDVKEDENQTLWKVPLNILKVDKSGQSVVDRSILLTERESTYPVDTSKPYKLNAGTSGVYRVLYPPERVKLLGRQAADPNSPFAVTDRMGLISDVMVLAKSGLCRTSDGLALINELRGEAEYLVWQSIADRLRGVLEVWWEMTDEVRSNMQAFIQSLFVPLVEKYGYDSRESDTVDGRQLRTLAINEAANSETPTVVEELRSRFKALVERNDYSHILPDIQTSTFVCGVRSGGKEEWETAKKVFLNPPSPSMRRSALDAMTASKDPEIIEIALNFMMNELKAGDVTFFAMGLNRNRFARRRAYEFFKENFDTLDKRFEGSFAWPYVIKLTLNGFSTKDDLEDVQAFFETKDTTNYSMPVEQALDAIRSNVKWFNHSNDDLVAWLKQWAESQGTDRKSVV